MRTPKTPGEWQSAMNGADVAMRLVSAQQYGILSPLVINEARCLELLAQGRKLGYRPRLDALEDFLKSLAGHLAEKPCGG